MQKPLDKQSNDRVIKKEIEMMKSLPVHKNLLNYEKVVL